MQVWRFQVFLSIFSVFAVLLVLLAIESHQDKVLNEIAIEENKKNGEI
jgi:hypothetical protein